MEIRDVIASLREKELQNRLDIESLRSQVNMLEGFTWNLLTLIASGQVDHIVITFDEEGPASGPATTDPTLF